MTDISATCDYDRAPSPEGRYSDLKGLEQNNKVRFNETDSPMKKNKRKRSEPRKRTDFSIKRFCPDSPGGGSAGSDSGRSEDIHEDTPDTLDRSNESPGQESSHSQQSSQGPSETDVPTSAIPQGMFLFPGHFPPNYLVPNIYKHHPAFLPNGANFGRMDILNNNTPSVQDEKPQESSLDYDDFGDNSVDDKNSKKSRKNYKNMTRERRVEANARERTRVHTISAAFDNLRRAVPSYSYNQKLSKLAILRIASSYIMALGKLADNDVEEDRSSRESFGELVDMCTSTIQTEGRARRRH